MFNIITDYEKLSDICDPIDTRKDNQLMQEIIINLKNTLRANKEMKGLSAPQLGYNKRIFCIKYSNGNIVSYVNPMIAKVKGLTVAREKCESLPGKEYLRIRHPEIEIFFTTPLGKPQQGKVLGAAAIMFQKLNDNLDGLLLSDIGLEIDEAFDKATEEERDEVIAMYLDSLDLRKEDAEKAVKESAEAKQLSDAIDYMGAVDRGEIKLTTEEIEIVRKEAE